MPYPVKTDNDYWASVESFAGHARMKRLDLVEYDCGPGCSSYGQVIAADLEAEIVKVRDFEDGSVWRGLMDHARVLGEQEIREALLFSGGYARKLLPPFENAPK